MAYMALKVRIMTFFTKWFIGDYKANIVRIMTFFTKWFIGDYKANIDSPSSPKRRIVVIGKTGAGKSSLGNTLLGEEWFKPHHSSSSGTAECKSKTKEVMNTQLTLIDTPGLFDTEKSEKDLKSEVIRSIVECAPGPHAFLFVLKVDRYTEHEEEVVTRICKYFSEEMLKYSVIVFTHGDQLDKGTTIQQFVEQNEKLKDLVIKCGNRCHVFDSKYWKNNEPGNKRSNSYQLKELLDTVERLVEHNGGNYTNEMLQKVDLMIQEEEEKIRQSGSGLSHEEGIKKAKHEVVTILEEILERYGAGPVLAAFLGRVAVAVCAVFARFTGAAQSAQSAKKKYKKL